MYLLDKFHLVQFYLFSADTLHFGKSSAIVAPNGSGKSAVLDAMQIVLHGGDQHAIDLNAQSGSHKGGRSIREYLLGYYRDDTNVRNNATCYLTMVFKDSTGVNPVVSAGLCLGASINDQKHRLNGMYILPGVDLTLAQHTHPIAGEQRPLPWPDFKALASELADEAGVDAADFTPNRLASEFVDRLLFRLNGSRRDIKVFSKALKNALNLKDVHDASAFVRERIIEDRTINISDFRHQLDTFRNLQQKVTDVIERVNIGQAILVHADKAISARMKRASYRTLSLELRRDEAMEDFDAATEARNIAKEELEGAQKHLEWAKGNEATEESRLELILDQERNNPALQEQRAHLEERKQRLTPIKTNLVQELSRIVDAFKRAKERDSEANAWGFLGQSWEALWKRITATDQAAPLHLETGNEVSLLASSSNALHPLLEACRKRVQVDTKALEDATSRLKITINKQERARQGKQGVPDDVMGTMNRLTAEGIDAVPVCDLVTITDSTWAPVVEAYLGHNVHALLVEKGKEEEAIAIFEAIPDGANPYSTRIVQPGKASVDVDSLHSQALAHLIKGDDPRAVQFLQARLGKMSALTKATRDGRDGLTRTGTVVNKGTVGRIRPKSHDELLLGKKDMRAQLDVLARERHAHEQVRQEAERRAASSTALLNVIKPLDGLQVSIERIHQWLDEHARQERALADSETVIKLQESPDILAMQELLEAAKIAYATAKQNLSDANQKIGAATTKLDTETRAYEAARGKADALAKEAAAGMNQPFVDAGWIDERRTQWDREGLTPVQQIKKCADKLELHHGAYGRLESELRNAFESYRAKYPSDSPLDASDPDAVKEAMTAEVRYLQDSELISYKSQADEAYGVAVKTFRSRIAANLRNNFDDMAAQMRELNSIMDRMPAFTNDERYHFKWWVNPECKVLHKFIVDVAERGGDATLFDDLVNNPEEFRSLLEDVDGPSQDLLRDYRRFFSFDVEVRHNGEKISTLKSRMEKGSGGEHRAPLFVVAGAALAAAYGKLQGNTGGMSLILFDELGDKIDGTNTRAVFEYLRSLGLQPVVAAPDDALGKISDSIDGYVELYRDESYLSINHVGIGPDAHVLLASDSVVAHPELLEAETRRVIAERGAGA